MSIEGKIVVLDPGHGGASKGAVGPTGLEEKTVNLHVALLVKSKLESRGIKVILTRDGDYDVPLDRRVAIAKQVNADIFVSIHHNANAERDPTINRTEIYYPWEGETPSEDLATHLYLAFRRHIGLETLPPLPSTYRVMRENVEPAVLGEASYISNPENEHNLRRKAYLECEASAYTEAIINYLAAGKANLQITPQAKYIEVTGDDIDPVTIEVFIDGKPYGYRYCNGRILVPYPQRRANLTVKVRTKGGNIEVRSCDVPAGKPYPLDIRPCYPNVMIDPLPADPLNLRLARYIKGCLRTTGVAAELTWSSMLDAQTDTYRVDKIFRSSPHIVVMVSHFEPTLVEDGVAGFYYYLNQEGKQLAKLLKDSLVNELNMNDLGLHECSKYPIIQMFGPRAYIVPGVWHPHSKVEDISYQRQIASIIANGIRKFWSEFIEPTHDNIDS